MSATKVPDLPPSLARLQRHASGRGEPSGGGNDAKSLRRAAMIGCLGGVPAALCMQVGLLSSLRRRGSPTRSGLPGTPYAASRDFLYLTGTQLQVQSVIPLFAD